MIYFVFIDEFPRCNVVQELCSTHLKAISRLIFTYVILSNYSVWISEYPFLSPFAYLFCQHGSHPFSSKVLAYNGFLTYRILSCFLHCTPHLCFSSFPFQMWTFLLDIFEFCSVISVNPSGYSSSVN